MATKSMVAVDAYQERMREEYAQLKERLEKLHTWNIRQEVKLATTSDGVPAAQAVRSPEDRYRHTLMVEQEQAMTRYKELLELRAALDNFDLD